MSDRKKAFWFIALLSVLVVVPFLGKLNLDMNLGKRFVD